MLRADDFEDLDVIEYFTRTAESRITGGRDTEDQARRTATKDKYYYQQQHPMALTYIRVIRPNTERTIPHFVRALFPRKEDRVWRNKYCANILALLKPWRRLSDLKHPNETWDEAFEEFNATASKTV